MRRFYQTFAQASALNEYSSFFIENVKLESNSTVIDVIYGGTLKEIVLPLPPIQEQTTIANFLDRKTAEIDSLIEKKTQLIRLYEEEKAAIINQAVTRGLGPQVSLKPSGIEWLGDIPANWEVKRLKYVTNGVITGKMPPSANAAYYKWDY